MAANRPSEGNRRRTLPAGFETWLNRSHTEQNAVAMIKMAPDRQLAMSGFVADWDLESGSTNNMVFRSDTTYFVKGYFGLYGSTVLESAVLKFTNGNSAQLMIDDYGSLAVKTSLYRPAMFTASDDNTIGAQITGSTGSPTNYYAYYALGYTAPTPVTISNVVVRYAQRGLYFSCPYQAVTNTIMNAQFVHCDQAVLGYSGTTNISTTQVRNALFNNIGDCYVGATNFFESENVTIDSATKLIEGYGAVSMTFTNSIFCNLTYTFLYSGDYNIVNNSPSALFQQVGVGYHYLTDTYRNQGTSAIDPQLKQTLAAMTTYPPIVLTSDITSDTALSPAVPRDAGTKDQGYHYPPLDYIMSALNVTNATLTLTNGVAIGVSGSKAVALRTGSKFISQGTPQQLNRLVRLKSVQEQPNSGGSSGSGLIELDSSGREIRLRFTEIPFIAGSSDNLLVSGFDSASYAVTPLALTDCQLLNVSQSFRTFTTGSTIAMTNNLCESCTFTWEQGTDGPYTFIDYALIAYNNLFQRGNLTFTYKDVGTVWTIKDNLFLPGTLTTGSGSFGTSASNNGYGTNGLTSLGGGGTKTIYTPDFVSGPLGRFYYPATGTNLAILINSGSRNATNAGLYHYTTTGISMETNSTVDIGAHSVAVDPLDALVGYWRFDDGSGTSAADSSTYGSTGTLLPSGTGPTWSTTAEIGSGALTFDGSNDYVQVPDNPALRVGGSGSDFAVAYWLYLRAGYTGSWRSLLRKGATDVDRTFSMWMLPSANQLFYRVSTTYSYDEGSSSNGTIPLNQWTHIAVVKSGNKLQLYINGQLDGSPTLNGSTISNTGPLYIGKTPEYTGTYCTLDDLRLYNRALTATEIATLASASTLDADGDGIPDYLEDANGNGTVDTGETDWLDSDSDGDGIPDGFEISLGTNPLSDEPNTTGQRLNYTYDKVGRLRTVTGKRTETITVDPETNVTQAQ